jgi:tetratricopeptide (TPR) repeat protein
VQLGDGEYTPPKVAFGIAEEFSKKALELDPNLGSAYVSRGTIRIFSKFQWAEAEADFKTALRLSPRYADLYHFYGHYFEVLGRTNEALATFRTALDLDPLSPVLPAEMAACFYHFRDYAKAEELCRKALQQNPGFVWGRIILSLVLLQQSRFPEAMEVLAEARRLDGGDAVITIALEAYAHGLAGDRERARLRLADFRAASLRSGEVAPYFLAVIHMGLGEKPEVLQFLEEAREKGSNWLPFIAVDPIFERVQTDPRFQRLIRGMGLRP